MSNYKSEFGGITLPAPLFPYAVADGQITVTLSPSVKFKTTSSQHLIT